MNPEERAAEYSRMCQSAPLEALAQLPAFVSGQDDPATRSHLFRFAALAARGANDLERSNGFLEDALREAEVADDSTARTTALLTKAYNLFLGGGQSDGALDILADLTAPDDPGLEARIAFQRGTILARTGRRSEALVLFKDAGESAAAADDGLLRARVHQNLGMMAAEDGDVAAARTHLFAARAEFAEMSLDFEVAFAEHNLGLAETYVGNLPEAFGYFERAGAKIRELAGNDFEAKTGHCRALMTAGLFTEAAALARQAADRCADAGLYADGAEMALLESLAWLESDELDRAKERAGEAAAAFDAQERSGPRASALLVEYAIQHREGSGPKVEDVTAALKTLEEAGQLRDSIEAKLLLAEVHAARGDTTKSEVLIAELEPALENAPADLQLAAATAKAAHLIGIGDTDGAQQAASDGYVLLAEQQVLLGAADLRVGLKQHANRLGQIGLSISIDERGADKTLAWQERISLATNTPRPVRSDANPEVRSRLAKLRALPFDQSDERRVHEEAIRQLDRGTRQVSHTPLRPLPAGELGAALDGATGIAFTIHHGQVLASTIVDRTVDTHKLGPLDDITKLVRAIRADLRKRLVRGGRSKTDRITTALDLLDERLFGPLDLNAGAMVIAPPAELFAVPWGALPSRRGQPTSVVTSLSAWAMTEAPDNIAQNGDGDGTVMIAGPDLEHGEREILKLRSTQPNASKISGQDASVETVLAGIDGAPLAHIVAHGTVRVDNPLFSSLQLANGELSVYELGDLQQAPSVVVLSACHVGLAAEAPGQELLGMVTGFLNAGTSCVVASTLPVPDSQSTIDLMSWFHRFLGQGMSPAEAWAEVQQTCVDDEQLLDTATFTIFGRG